MTVLLDDMLKINSADLYEIVKRAEPLHLDAIADTGYTGIDLSMPLIGQSNCTAWPSPLCALALDRTPRASTASA